MTKKIFIIAGEASGDLLGAALMRDLKILSPDADLFNGIGGKAMQAEGLVSIFPMTDLSIMGLTEVIKHLPLMIKRLKQTHKAIIDFNPDVIVTIDSPDFTLRVAKKIKRIKPNIPIIHYVAPTVWAWRPGRAKKIAKFLDGLLCLFPFEPKYFTPHGLKAEFVGHPLVNLITSVTETQKLNFLRAHNLDANKQIVCLLPGSRVREIETLMPIFIDTLAKLRHTIPDLQVIIPCLDHTKECVSKMAEGHNITVFAPESNSEKYIAFASSHAALHASGTVSLELALCGTPMVTTYKVGSISAFIGRMLVTTPYVNLVNIILNRPVVPEMIQENATAEQLASLVQALLTQKIIHQAQQEQLIDIRQYLNENAPQSAARFVSSYMNV